MAVVGGRIAAVGSVDECRAAVPADAPVEQAPGAVVLPGLIDARTRVVAVGAASNALGTLNDVPAVVAAARAAGDALVYVDAVESVPHVATDVAALGCDFLACSPYKFFGPHQGVLWGRADAWARLDAYKVRPAGNEGAHRLETGTPSFEGQAGVLGRVEYLDWLGRAVAFRRSLTAG